MKISNLKFSTERKKSQKTLFLHLFKILLKEQNSKHHVNKKYRYGRTQRAVKNNEKNNYFIKLFNKIIIFQ